MTKKTKLKNVYINWQELSIDLQKIFNRCTQIKRASIDQKEHQLVRKKHINRLNLLLID